MAMEKSAEETIKFIITNISELGEVESPTYTIGGLPWKFIVKEECIDSTGFIKYLSTYICCELKNPRIKWYCKVDVEFRLLSNKRYFPFCSKLVSIFNSQARMEGKLLVNRAEIMNLKMGYVVKDCAILEIRVNLSDIRIFEKLPIFDAEEDSLSDVAIVLENTKLNVRKTELSKCSPVFQVMLCSNFKEREQKEIVLYGEYREFLELLQILHTNHELIDEINVENLMRLADKYDIKVLMDKCEQFLMTNEEFSNKRKLIWACQYFMVNLKKVCLQRITTVANIRMLLSTSEFRELYDSVKVALFNEILQQFSVDSE